MNSILSGPCTVVQAAPSKNNHCFESPRNTLTHSCSWRLTLTTSDLGSTDDIHLTGSWDFFFFVRISSETLKGGPFPGPRAGVRVAAVTPGEYLHAREPIKKTKQRYNHEDSFN